MQCPFCHLQIHPSVKQTTLGQSAQPRYHEGAWRGDAVVIVAESKVCPSCGGATIDLIFTSGITHVTTTRVFPTVGPLGPPPEQVPADLAQDFAEANAVLPISPKASAALSRRCLQAILTEAGYKSRNLASQVDAVLEENDASKSLPPDLRDSLDAIRNFGNFSAHPITDVTSLQIIDVDTGEAEWSLRLVADLFDHYYVRPALAAARRASLNQKLSAAGKPASKVAPSDEVVAKD